MSAPPVPFSNEDEFKAWMKEGSVNEKKAKPPNDLEEPNADELALVEKLKTMVKPELLDACAPDAPDLFLSRMLRGYALRNFYGVEDSLERTAVMTNLSLAWRKEIDMPGLPEKKLPKRELWDKMWPQQFEGTTDYGQCIWYMIVPSNFSKDFEEQEAAMLHAQDMATLTKHKADLMIEQNRKFTGNHHVLIIDMNSDRGSVSKNFMKYFSKVVRHKLGPNTTQHFFPDALKGAFVINTPFMYRAMWSMAGLFMERVTYEKYKLLGSDYMDKLLAAGMKKDSLPMNIGGYGPNPRGYRAKLPDDVKRGTTKEIILKPPRKASKLTWFIEVNKDIQFKISSKTGGAATVHESGTVDTAKNGTIDLDGDKKLDEIVLELTNTNHKSISVTYTLDLD